MISRIFNKEEYKKYFFIFIATNLIGIAVALILESRLGCDPIGLLCDGISKLFSIKFGTASFIYNVGVIGIALFIVKNNVGIGTIVYGLLSGFFIDFYKMLFSALNLGNSLESAVFTFIIGEICMSLAFAILIQLNLGMTALDAILTKIERITNVPYAYIKITTDIVLVISGILMGGIFGAGTIISALVTGILVTKFNKIINYIQLEIVKA